MKLIITRHGETEENKAGIIQGHLPGHLSKTGIDQAKKVALRLKDEQINHIYSSDLARASDTAKEIAKYHKDTPIIFTEFLKEKFLGEWQGKTKKELGFSTDTSITGIFPKDGESPKDLFKRANKFLHKILSKHSNDTILFVAHNGINKAIIAAITNKTYKEINTIERLNNTSISIFEIDKNNNYNTILFNSIQHLK